MEVSHTHRPLQIFTSTHSALVDLMGSRGSCLRSLPSGVSATSKTEYLIAAELCGGPQSAQGRPGKGCQPRRAGAGPLRAAPSAVAALPPYAAGCTSARTGVAPAPVVGRVVVQRGIQARPRHMCLQVLFLCDVYAVRLTLEASRKGGWKREGVTCVCITS